MTLEEAIASLESYAGTLLDTCGKSAGIARTEIVELQRRIGVAKDSAFGHVTTSEEETANEPASELTPAGEDAGSEDQKPLGKMTKPELLALAAERGIDVPE